MKTLTVKKNPSSFYPIVGLMAGILLVSAIGGLGIVWLRQQITLSAARAKDYENEINALDRKIRHLDTRIASVHHPESLRRRAEALGLQLGQPVAKQVVRLPAKPGQLNKPAEGLPDDPLFVSLDMALLESSAANPALPAKKKPPRKP